MNILSGAISRIIKDLNHKKESTLKSICGQLNEDWDEIFMRRITRTTTEGRPDTESYWLDFSSSNKKHLATFSIKYPENMEISSRDYNVVMEIESEFDL